MSTNVPKNLPTLIYSISEMLSIFGRLPDKRSIQVDREWIDAYNTQISRILRGRDVSEINDDEARILRLLLSKSISSYWDYIFRKYCKS